jgi:hypothetical protein
MGSALLKVLQLSVSWHLAWLWLWFIIGMLLYMLKRAYYLVTGPNPVASTYKQFIQRCWIPLLVRGVIDSIFFWICFNPELLAKGMTYLHLTTFAWVASTITQFAPMSFLFGHTIDSFVDTAVSKIPGFKDWLPQMPGPLPPTPAQAELKAQSKAAADQPTIKLFPIALTKDKP